MSKICFSKNVKLWLLIIVFLALILGATACGSSPPPISLETSPTSQSTSQASTSNSVSLVEDQVQEVDPVLAQGTKWFSSLIPSVEEEIYGPIPIGEIPLSFLSPDYWVAWSASNVEEESDLLDIGSSKSEVAITIPPCRLRNGGHTISATAYNPVDFFLLDPVAQSTVTISTNCPDGDSPPPPPPPPPPGSSPPSGGGCLPPCFGGGGSLPSPTPSPGSPPPPLPPPPPPDAPPPLPELPDEDPGRSFGDPHLITLDGLFYDFQATGDFILLKSLDGSLEIQDRMVPVIEGLSRNEAFAARIGPDRVGFYPDLNPPLAINGQLAPAGFNRLPGGGLIYRSNDSNGYPQFRVVWPTEEQAVIRLTRYPTIDIYAPPDQQGNYQGLLGNFNSNVDDDLTTRQGQIMTTPLTIQQLYQEFGQSWAVSDNESLFEEVSPLAPSFPTQVVSVSMLEDDDRQAAQASCEAAGITDPILLEACILDVGATGEADLAEEMQLFQSPRANAALVSQIDYDPQNGYIIDIEATEDKLYAQQLRRYGQGLVELLPNGDIRVIPETNLIRAMGSDGNQLYLATGRPYSLDSPILIQRVESDGRLTDLLKLQIPAEEEPIYGGYFFGIDVLNLAIKQNILYLLIDEGVEQLIDNGNIGYNTRIIAVSLPSGPDIGGTITSGQDLFRFSEASSFIGDDLFSMAVHNDEIFVIGNGFSGPFRGSLTQPETGLIQLVNFRNLEGQPTTVSSLVIDGNSLLIPVSKRYEDAAYLYRFSFSGELLETLKLTEDYCFDEFSMTTQLGSTIISCNGTNILRLY